MLGVYLIENMESFIEILRTHTILCEIIYDISKIDYSKYDEILTENSIILPGSLIVFTDINDVLSKLNKYIVSFKEPRINILYDYDLSFSLRWFQKALPASDFDFRVEILPEYIIPQTDDVLAGDTVSESNTPGNDYSENSTLEDSTPESDAKDLDILQSYAAQLRSDINKPVKIEMPQPDVRVTSDAKVPVIVEEVDSRIHQTVNPAPSSQPQIPYYIKYAQQQNIHPQPQQSYVQPQQNIQQQQYVQPQQNIQTQLNIKPQVQQQGIALTKVDTSYINTRLNVIKKTTLSTYLSKCLIFTEIIQRSGCTSMAYLTAATLMADGKRVVFLDMSLNSAENIESLCINKLDRESTLSSLHQACILNQPILTDTNSNRMGLPIIHRKYQNSTEVRKIANTNFVVAIKVLLADYDYVIIDLGVIDSTIAMQGPLLNEDAFHRIYVCDIESNEKVRLLQKDRQGFKKGSRIICNKKHKTGGFILEKKLGIPVLCSIPVNARLSEDLQRISVDSVLLMPESKILSNIADKL